MAAAARAVVVAARVQEAAATVGEGRQVPLEGCQLTVGQKVVVRAAASTKLIPS